MTHHIHTVIVSYNRLHLTQQCISSYLATVTLPHTWLVVDNGSDEQTIAWLTANVDNSNTMYLGENKFPGFATNRGWEQMPPETTLLHRSDNDFAFCVAPETRVLCNDYAWRPIAEIYPGDDLVAFDEHLPVRGRGHQRRLRRGRVQAKLDRKVDRVRVITDMAQPVITSQTHLWLVLDTQVPPYKQRTPVWKESRALVPGDRILRFGDVWGDTPLRDQAAYLAGLFDGEGCLSQGSRLGFTQNPGAVLDRGRRFLTEMGFHTGPPSAPKLATTLNIRGGIPEFMRFLHQVPTARFRDPWWIGKRITSQNGYRHLHYSTVQAVERVRKGDVVSLGTATRTFIAEGMYSHNCPGWCEEVVARFEDPLVGQVGMRTGEEELWMPVNVGGNNVIRRELWDQGLRYKEWPWGKKYPIGCTEDTYLSPAVTRLGYEWTRVTVPCIESLAYEDPNDPYYIDSWKIRGIK